MKSSKNLVELIKKFEGFRPKPYLDIVGIPTIGYGSTFYPDGKKVSTSDRPINESTGESLLLSAASKFENVINSLVKKKINQNQFDALVSFIFNIGPTAFKKSTILRKINLNPSDPSIREEFLRWNKSGGKVINGLTMRRNLESNLYFRI